MKPAPFEFARPDSKAEALELLAANPEGKVLAGGQSLVPLMSMRLAAPAMLVDINGIAELAFVDAEPGRPADGVRVGALARHSDVGRHPGAAAVQPLLPAALRLVAHPTVRNRGTTVGSLAHADPAAELPAVLALLGGRLSAESTSGRRVIEAEDLFVAPLESSLRHDEVAVEAWFPPLAPGAGVAIDEVARRHGDYALCGVAALVAPAEAAPRTVRAAYFSVCDVPTVVDLTEVLAAGPSEAAYAEAAELALERLQPEGDIHASAAYRTQLVRVLTARVLAAAYRDADDRASTLSA